MQVTVLYHSLFAQGVSGDLVTVLLIGRYRDMHTTNNLSLGGLAVSDLFIPLRLAFHLYRPPPVALETLEVRAASLSPASLLGQGLHLRHAAARDHTQPRALLGNLRPAASAGPPYL